MYEHLRYLVDIAFVVALTFAVYKISKKKSKRIKGGKKNGITFEN